MSGSRRLRLGDFTIYEGARFTAWEQDVDVWSPYQDGRRRDDRSVAVLVELDVDGVFDRVAAELGQFGELASLDRVIAVLEKVRDQIAVIPNGSQPGRCFARGHYSGCHRQVGHDGPHKFTVPKHDRLSEDERAAYATTPWEGSPVDAPVDGIGVEL